MKKLDNVAKVYFLMQREKGLSDSAAVKLICDAVGLRSTRSYANDWPNDNEPYRSIPPAVVQEMQKAVVVYAAEKAGIKASKDKLLSLVELLSPKVRKG
jgi:hypothetical protein